MLLQGMCLAVQELHNVLDLQTQRQFLVSKDIMKAYRHQQ